jgi:hypothetical protein
VKKIVVTLFAFKYITILEAYMHRTFTQLDQRRDRIFVLDDAPVKPTVVARLMITRSNGWKTIVEVEDGSTFHSFFKYYKQFKNKRSTKELIRIANRNDGGISKPRLENIAEKLSIYQSMSNPVVTVQIRILKKREYRRLIDATPDQLGLTNTAVNLPLSRFASLSTAAEVRQ